MMLYPTRRDGVIYVLIGAFATSCSKSVPTKNKRVSFGESLEILNHVETLSEFVNMVGRHGFVNYFAVDDGSVYYNLPSERRDYWRGLYISNPTDFIERIPIGTKMLNFEYLFNRPINPTRGRLFVCVDDSDRIIGWIYSRTLVGHEREAMPA